MYVLAIIVGVCALGAALIAFSRKPPRDDVERFHRARQMTTEWSRRYAATGHLELPNDDHDHQNGNGQLNGSPEREPVEQRH